MGNDGTFSVWDSIDENFDSLGLLDRLGFELGKLERERRFFHIFIENRINANKLIHCNFLMVFVATYDFHPTLTFLPSYMKLM